MEPRTESHITSCVNKLPRNYRLRAQIKNEMKLE